MGTPVRVLVVAACVVVLVGGLRAASAIIAPFLIALFVAILSLPVLFWLRRRVPVLVAVLGTILMDMAVLVAAGYLVGNTANQLASDMDGYQDSLVALVDDGVGWLEDRGLELEGWRSPPPASAAAGDDAGGQPSPAADAGAQAASPRATDSGGAGDAGARAASSRTAAAGTGGVGAERDAQARGFLSRFDPNLLIDFANRTVRFTASAVSSLLVVFLILVFMLFEAATFRRKARTLLASDAARERFSRMAHEIQRYIGIKTAVSAATGLLIGVWVGVLGVDFAIFWGLVAFVLNFIPNLGSIIAAVPTTLLATVQIGVGGALLVALGYLVVNMVIGNFIEPHLMGRRLGLSTLVVVLSLVFWGWVWGPIGMLLSVPLTMVVKIMLENTEEFRWVAVLLGDGRAAALPPAAQPPGGAGPDS